LRHPIHLHLVHAPAIVLNIIVTVAQNWAVVHQWWTWCSPKLLQQAPSFGIFPDLSFLLSFFR
jgi:hypothetical protein